VSARCSEIVVYRIKPRRKAEAWAQRARVLAHLAAMDGFLGEDVQVSVEDSDLYCDRLHWRDREAARQGYQAFKRAPGAAEFMECVAEVYFSGHFTERDA